MIKSFRHRGLRLLYEKNDSRRLEANLVPRLNRILAVIDAAEKVEELSLFPGWRLHRLKGDLKGCWSISVSGNWRVIFRFIDEHAYDVNLVDYH